MANSSVKMTLHGAKELEAALKALPDRLTKSVVQRALIKASAHIVKDAQGRVAGRYPRLAKAIQVRTTLSRRHRRSSGARKGEAKVFLGYTAAKYGLAHLVEFGTGPRYQKKTGRYTGQVPAFPHLRPAWDAGKNQLIDELGEMLWLEIERAAKRLGRRAAKARAAR